jgi:hypothetical protein
VAHAVGEQKAEALGGLGVPVAEIDATVSWEIEEAGVTRVACVRNLGFPPCLACASAALAEAGRSTGGEEAELAELESYRARGLLGPPSGRPASGDVALSPEDQRALSGMFRCPACGSSNLAFGRRVARHACPDAAPRAVAWRGYDGELVQMRWWRAPRE